MEQKTVLLTGAAGGLGRAVARIFSLRGWRVIATDLETALGSLEEINGTMKLPMDVASEESVRIAFEHLRIAGTTLDLVIDNAGIDRYFPLSEAPDPLLKQIFEVNVFGACRVNRAFLPLLRRPGGRIILIGSESLGLTLPFMPYPLTKNLLERYGRVIRQELRFIGIDVVIIRPGAIRTRILEDIPGIRNPVENSMLQQQFDRFRVSANATVPHAVEPAKVAELIFRAATVRSPRPVYRINNSFTVRVMSLVPFSLLERLVGRMIR